MYKSRIPSYTKSNYNKKIVPEKGTLPDFYLITQKCFMAWEAAIKRKISRSVTTSLVHISSLGIQGENISNWEFVTKSHFSSKVGCT